MTAFLSHLAVERKVAAGTQIQALSALLFLYKQVLGAQRPRLSRTERASLLYGSGLRVLECLRLRVKDLNFAYSQILLATARATRTG